MPRLPPRPQITFTPEGAPFSEDLGDVYFSGDGLEEKRAVFLAGCGMPEAWANRDHFAIGELGFGTGLNFLIACDLWRRHRPSPKARLSYLSFEGALLSAADAARIHALWPDLAGLSSDLICRWPTRARGVQRIVFPHGITLTLAIDDIAASLPQADARIDAWFLDGFAPSKNPAMWSSDILAHVARLSAPGARAATYSVAGDVRRSLEAAGFTVAKMPGHGRKKQRLEATLSASPQTDRLSPPKDILILGAGIAGACTARAFLDRGCNVTVVDASSAPGSGASGNALALVMPRLDAADGPPARGLIEAFLLAQRAYLALGADAAAALDVSHLPRGDTEATRFARLLADPPLDAHLLSAIETSDPARGVIHHAAIAVRPRIALERLLNGAACRFNSRVTACSRNERPTVTLASGEALAADLVVICAGMGIASLSGNALPLTGRLGQIECASGAGSGHHAIADGGYAVEAFDDLVFGATFEPAPADAPEGVSPVTAAARQTNLDTLARLRPDKASAIDPARLVSRAAIRATTPDRLPFAGALPPAENEKAPELAPAPIETIRLIGGLGSRGFLWAPLLAELVVSEAFGEPCPVERSVRDSLAPGRFRVRALRRQGLTARAAQAG
jgi:tRNA 5-methylaminomethyl-2-thiouridine biosynthesis bifunctional protein